MMDYELWIASTFQPFKSSTKSYNAISQWLIANSSGVAGDGL